MSILFHSLHHCKAIPSKTRIKNWIIRIISNHKKDIGSLNVIFIDDKKILEINNEYLKSDFYTDIITFNYNSGNKISGDIYISIERVEDNAHKFNCTFQSEILRVIVHGAFHLLGYDDKTAKQKVLMRKLEDEALNEYLNS